MRLFTLFFSLFFVLAARGQDSTSHIEYYQGKHNRYKIKYHEGSVYFSNEKAIFTWKDNTVDWQSVYEITMTDKDIRRLFLDAISPYMKGAPLNDENDYFHLFFYYDLTGKIDNVIFCWNRQLNIPFSVFEALEEKLKKETRIGIKPRYVKADTSGVICIQLSISYYLMDYFSPE